ncbi:MAG TPA: 4a-hydroxytetrahydrobiopterin dehydratase [Janthinobacterium sp.]|jgi:4a-hydroxytetrahydrobiopterin dehydratase|nr:4a-hydroxytetrahydrobiopterin dehydratase [Janthinobacterium sp.]
MTMTTPKTPDSTAALLASRCAPRHSALDEVSVARLLRLVPGWSVDGGKLCKTFGFGNYYETLAFVNALAYITHAQDHHPELTITYKTCVIRYDTHSVNQDRGGLSENDFICAAKADAVYQSAATGA